MSRQNQPSGGRRAEACRQTADREVRVVLDLDGSGQFAGRTAVAPFDRSLSALARQACFDLAVECVADPVFDFVPLAEDVGAALGEALLRAVGDRNEVVQIGSQVAPLEATLVRCVVDLSGRPCLAWRVPDLPDETATGRESAALRRFFAGLARGGELTVHVDLVAAGKVAHVRQAALRALGGALRHAVERRPAGPPPVDPAGAL